MKHVMNEIFDLEDSDKLIKAVESQGIESVMDLLSLNDVNIDNLDLKQDGTTEVIPPSRKNLVRILQEWNYYLCGTNDLKRVDWDDPLLVTREGFDEFRTGVYDPNNSLRKSDSNVSGPRASLQGQTKSSPIRSYDPVSDFRRGIKRDKAHYIRIKDEKQWDEWKRRTETTITTHGCAKVIDLSYVPSTSEERELFTEQNRFIYDVFNDIIQTDMGKHFVRLQATAMNAQEVWKQYCKYMTTSTRADLEIEKLIGQLTNSRLDSGYRQTYTKFVLGWLEKLRRYENMTPISAHFPPVMKKAMIQNAVANVQIFKDIKTSEDIDIAKGRTAMTYDEYISVIQKIAGAEDERKGGLYHRRAQREANYHMFDNNGDDNAYGDQMDPPYIQDTYDISDHDVTEQFGSFTIQEARRTGRPSSGYRRPSLRKDVWQGLSLADQKTWDAMSDAGKRSIIFGSMGPKPTSGITHPPTGGPREANYTNLESDAEIIFSEDSDATEESVAAEGDTLINAAKRAKPTDMKTTSQADLRRLLSMAPGDKAGQKKVNFNIKANMTTMYHVSRSVRDDSRSLMDRGANGGVAGDNVRVISKTDRQVDVTGVGNHQITGLQIVTAGGVVPTQRGDVIAILHQYAHCPMGKTIHSCIQLEHFHNTVNDRSANIDGGTQSVTTLDGFILPLEFKEGLPYLPIRPFTDDEWDSLPHVILTSDQTWDPSVMDNDRDTEAWLQTQANHPAGTADHAPFDAFGEYRGAVHIVDGSQYRTVVTNFADLYTKIDDDHLAPTIDVHATTIRPNRRNYQEYSRYFLGSSAEVIRQTFSNTTQFARTGVISGHIYDTHRAPFPALNVHRRNEPVATDTVYSDVPAINGGATCAQFFVGCNSYFSDVYDY